MKKKIICTGLLICATSTVAQASLQHEPSEKLVVDQIKINGTTSEFLMHANKDSGYTLAKTKKKEIWRKKRRGTSLNFSEWFRSLIATGKANRKLKKKV